MFSERNGIKSEINNRKIPRKPQNIWKINSTLSNNPCVLTSLGKLELSESIELMYWSIEVLKYGSIELNENKNTK